MTSVVLFMNDALHSPSSPDSPPHSCSGLASSLLSRHSLFPVSFFEINKFLSNMHWMMLCSCHDLWIEHFPFFLCTIEGWYQPQDSGPNVLSTFQHPTCDFSRRILDHVQLETQPLDDWITVTGVTIPNHYIMTSVLLFMNAVLPASAPWNSGPESSYRFYGCFFETAEVLSNMHYTVTLLEFCAPTIITIPNNMCATIYERRLTGAGCLGPWLAAWSCWGGCRESLASSLGWFSSISAFVFSTFLVSCVVFWNQ